jgi:hypothetical protein
VAAAERKHATIVAINASPLDFRIAKAIKLNFNGSTKMKAASHHNAMDG